MPTCALGVPACNTDSTPDGRDDLVLLAAPLCLFSSVTLQQVLCVSHHSAAFSVPAVVAGVVCCRDRLTVEDALARCARVCVRPALRPHG